MQGQSLRAKDCVCASVARVCVSACHRMSSSCGCPSAVTSPFIFISPFHVNSEAATTGTLVKRSLSKLQQSKAVIVSCFLVLLIHQLVGECSRGVHSTSIQCFISMTHILTFHCLCVISLSSQPLKKLAEAFRRVSAPICSPGQCVKTLRNTRHDQLDCSSHCA